MVFFANPTHGFGPAMPAEQIVFGARRPGFPFRHVPRTAVAGWVDFMQRQGVQRLVCLLPEQQLAHYPGNLLEQYRAGFGPQNVCWAPIRDFALIDEYRLVNLLLPFLLRADREQRRVVVHCSAGIGRTGHILAAWLVVKHGLTNQHALAAVRQMGRNAQEARDPQLGALLDRCRQLRQALP